MKCKHARIPAYDRTEHETYAKLNARIDAGDLTAYPELTRLAVNVAVHDGRFYAGGESATCDQCPCGKIVFIAKRGTSPTCGLRPGHDGDCKPLSY